MFVNFLKHSTVAEKRKVQDPLLPDTTKLTHFLGDETCVRRNGLNQTPGSCLT